MSLAWLEELTTKDPQYNIDINKRPLHHVAREHHTNCYDTCVTRKVQIFYIIAAVLWLLIIYFGNFSSTYDYVSIIILSIPLVVFLINYSGCARFETDSASDLFRGNFLSFGYLIFIVFINWDKVADRSKFFRILVVSLILIMLSLIDLWVDKEDMELMKHTKSALQTTSLVLLAFALYQYYLVQASK